MYRALKYILMASKLSADDSRPSVKVLPIRCTGGQVMLCCNASHAL